MFSVIIGNIVAYIIIHGFFYANSYQATIRDSIIDDCIIIGEVQDNTIEGVVIDGIKEKVVIIGAI